MSLKVSLFSISLPPLLTFIGLIFSLNMASREKDKPFLLSAILGGKDEVMMQLFLVTLIFI